MPINQYLYYLKNLDEYFSLINDEHKNSIYFENLIAKIFCDILDIKFFSIANEDKTQKYRLTWYGNHCHPIKKAPSDKPDIVARCHNFYLIVEATLKTGANQWTQEYASSIRHATDFISSEGCDPTQIYILLITKKISEDTYNSLKANPNKEFKFIPFDTTHLIEILETVKYAYTLKHLDFRKLLMEIPRIIEYSCDLDNFKEELNKYLIVWRKEIYRREKNTVIGMKSYEAMHKIRRNAIAESEIFRLLLESEDVKHYLDFIGERVTVRIIEDSLVSQNLIAWSTKTTYDEIMYYPVPYILDSRLLITRQVVPPQDHNTTAFAYQVAHQL